MNIKNKGKYEIVLLSTKGCIGCSIMDDIITKALKESSKTIKYTILDVRSDERGSKMAKELNVKDFPTIVFISNGIIKYHYTGNMPVAVIVRWIDIHLV